MKNYYFRSKSGCISFEALYWVYYSVREKCFYMKFYLNNKSFKYKSNPDFTKKDLEKGLDEFQVPHIVFVAENGDTYYIHLNRFLVYDNGTLYVKSLNGDIQNFNFEDEKFTQYAINRYDYKEDEEVEEPADKENQASSYNPPEETKEPEKKIKAPEIRDSFLYGG